MSQTTPAAATTADHLAIDRVLARYCRAMDRIDAALGYSVWHEEGTCDYGHYYKGSGRGFIDWVCDYHRGLDGHSHQIAQRLIEIDGRCATSETYVTVGLVFRDMDSGAQMLTTGRGRYLDRWSCRNGVWAIDHREFVHDFSITQPGAVTLSEGRRDASDPSYAYLGALGLA